MSGFVGPTDETRRDLARPETWVGLSTGDHALLVAFLDQLAVGPKELHTHVAVGLGDVEIPSTADAVGHRLMTSLWPRRVDAAVRFGDAWWLIECKVGCAHYVLGQCLCYAFWWMRDCPECPLERVVVVTDCCHDDVESVLCASGIDVVELELDPLGAGPGPGGISAVTSAAAGTAAGRGRS